ncbi:class I SAM-dependent methyltransferase [Yoonia sp. I 8.24]|uniref:class I SAM-dependent methyltransferase n=1 Tax=Yoonia sp. I 8.24 TaxID=1537229 RepID=UPI001EDEEB31|nr:class I SAM-dependent methyltransferase [Yoonia sp. I 8.24]MCG3268811.1 class I SAM-dependent methyltransferase [Yoonia sp. I 8.24]
MKLLERHKSRRARWFRSLFAIYDLDDLIHLELPWWTFDAIEAVDEILAARPDARVLEWGSGASTLWLAARAKQVTSIEHDLDWAREVQLRLDASPNGSKVALHHVGSQTKGNIGSNKRGFDGQFFDDYVAAIGDVSGDFDLIVIDGRAREACLTAAISRLAPGGVILLDDFKRKRYRDAASASGLSVDAKEGLAVCLPLPDSTALLTVAI